MLERDQNPRTPGGRPDANNLATAAAMNFILLHIHLVNGKIAKYINSYIILRICCNNTN